VGITVGVYVGSGVSDGIGVTLGSGVSDGIGVTVGTDVEKSVEVADGFAVAVTILLGDVNVNTITGLDVSMGVDGSCETVAVLTTLTCTVFEHPINMITSW